jgi:acyl-CoA synthetase (AMP-forming)/AMP-acid ligase II
MLFGKRALAIYEGVSSEVMIVEMLARNARMYPNDTALIELKHTQGLRKEITWKEFDERVNRVANALIARGIRKGDKVIHWMLNSINWLEAYFGIIRTGAWAVPLNFRFSADDFKYCADIAEAKAMILGEQFIDRVETVRSQLPTIKEYILVGQPLPKGMEDFEKVMEEASPQPVEVGLKEEDECGLYFTSGTTGAPKPILLAHKNMQCAAITENRHHFQTRDDIFLLLQPLYHTGGKMHWFGSLVVGGPAVLLCERITAQNIFESVHNERATIVMLLVPWIQDILGALDRGELKIEDYDLSCWRLMHSGAQPVAPSLIKRWKEYFPNMHYDDLPPENDTSYNLIKGGNKWPKRDILRNRSSTSSARRRFS